MVHLSLLETAWGAFGYAVHGEQLIGTLLPEPEPKARKRLQGLFPGGIWSNAPPRRGRHGALLPDFREQVLRYFAGQPVEFTPKVDLSGCAEFHQRVLLACAKLRFGETITYGGLAAKIGHPGAARAVGQAMAINPIPLVIPCHRVVAANGRLGGFSSPSGARQKLNLLRLENPLYEPAGMGLQPISRRSAAKQKVRSAQAQPFAIQTQ